MLIDCRQSDRSKKDKERKRKEDRKTDKKENRKTNRKQKKRELKKMNLGRRTMGIAEKREQSIRQNISSTAGQ